MNLFTRGLKSKKVQASAASSLNASASVPNSGFAFVDNSQGASAAISELSENLSFSLNNIESGGSLKSHAELQFQRLEEEVSKFANSRLDHVLRTPYSCCQSTAELLTLSWEAAAAVYVETESPNLPSRDARLKRVKYTERSWDGTKKSLAIYQAYQEYSSAADALDPNPILIIAVRGSKHSVDHMVNANYKNASLEEWMDTSVFSQEPPSIPYAHSGFLNVAKAMDVEMLETIKAHSSHHIIFTGHSAGGAVATLLHLKTLQTSPSAQVSLITFGAPPIISIPLNLHHHLRPPTTTAKRSNLTLNIMNEYDLITRADSAYLLSLVDIFRVMYDQPPMSELPSTSCHPSSSQCLPLPKPDLYHFGDKIVVQCKPSLANEAAGGRDLSLWSVRDEAFSKLVFCGIDVHRRAEYSRRMRWLRDNLIENRDKDERRGFDAGGSSCMICK